MKQQLKQIVDWLNTNKLDVAYISDFHSISYLTGFESDPIERTLALFVFPNAEPFLFTPALEVESAKQTGWEYPVFGYQDSEDAYALIAEHLRASSPSLHRWAVEEGQLTLARANDVKRHVNEAEFVANLTPVLTEMRLIKTPDEIAKMHQAGRDVDRAFEFGFAALQTGATELEVVAQLEYDLKRTGVVGMSFESLVQFGKHAAEPHGDAGNTKLQDGDLALFDLGTIYEGYVSDATRTVAYKHVSDHQRDIYNIVLEAQLKAQDAAKPGITAGELDAVARDVITKAGYGEYFVHRLGHGIGSSVHESIQIAEGNELVLQPGMAFSIEPGIYIPNDLGIRIEDSVVVTATGADSFTHLSKELRVID